jgi:hypothetical protein
MIYGIWLFLNSAIDICELNLEIKQLSIRQKKILTTKIYSCRYDEILSIKVASRKAWFQRGVGYRIEFNLSKSRLLIIAENFTLCEEEARKSCRILEEIIVLDCQDSPRNDSQNNPPSAD